MKRILTSILAFLLLFCMGISFTGCSKNGFGKFYTLQEAYNKELLTDNDLIEIADYYQGENLMDKKC